MSTEPVRFEAAEREYSVRTETAYRVPLRPAECIVVGYFIYTATLAAVWNVAWQVRLLMLLIPACLFALAVLGSKYGSKASGVFREWFVSAPLLLAYQQVDWFRRAGDAHNLEATWVQWDRTLLNSWHLRSAVESLGPVLPSIMELAYLMVYSLPVFALWILYKCHLRSRVDRFLFTFLLGTLTAYALLPLFPTETPRLLFPGADLPHVNTALHRANLWLLDHGDIRVSVFPSGHVAAAFSAAFGMLLAFPERKRHGLVFLVAAVAIAVDTVYSRYHYLADGLAGVVIAGAAALVSCLVFSRKRVA